MVAGPLSAVEGEGETWDRGTQTLEMSVAAPWYRHSVPRGSSLVRYVGWRAWAHQAHGSSAFRGRRQHGWNKKVRNGAGVCVPWL